MARRIKPEPSSQQSVDRLAFEMNQRFEKTASAESVEALKSTLSRFALEVDHRLEKTASQESVDAIKTALDRHIASMDRVAGEILDNRRSLIVFDSMLGDHRRRLDSHDHRLTSLESRPTPPNP